MTLEGTPATGQSFSLLIDVFYWNRAEEPR